MLANPVPGTAERPRRARSGQEVVGSRLYYPGHPRRLIHWRNTARLGRLAVKEMEDSSQRALTVVFETRESVGEGRDTTLEYSIKLAASMGVHAIRTGDSIGLLGGNLQGEWAEPATFMRELALLDAGASPSLADLLLMAPSSSPVVVIVHAANAEAVSALEHSLPRLSGLSAVVLEGFAAPEDEAGAAARLRSAGIATVVCRNGDISDAIRQMEGFDSAQGLRGSGPSPLDERQGPSAGRGGRGE